MYIYMYICLGRNCDPVGSPILLVETAIAVPTRIMLVGTAITVSNGRILAERSYHTLLETAIQ